MWLSLPARVQFWLPEDTGGRQGAHECIRDPVGNANRAVLWHLPWMQCSVLPTYWLAGCWLPAHKQPEHLQFLAVAGVIPAITSAWDSSGSRLVAGLTLAPLSTVRGAHTTSLGEACSFPPSCKHSRQPAKTCPRKGFPQHLLHRTVSTFRLTQPCQLPTFFPITRPTSPHVWEHTTQAGIHVLKQGTQAMVQKCNTASHH